MGEGIGGRRSFEACKLVTLLSVVHPMLDRNLNSGFQDIGTVQTMPQLETQIVIGLSQCLINK